MKRTSNSLDIYIEDLSPSARAAVEALYGFVNEPSSSLKRLSRVKPIVSIPIVAASDSNN